MSSSTSRSTIGTFLASLQGAGWLFWCCTSATAAVEGAVGWWLKHLPLESRLEADALVSWLGMLLGLLGSRVATSWGRDLAQETAAIRAGDRHVRGIWATTPSPEDAPWFTREGRDAVEQGTRAALVLASSLAALCVLLPLMIWLSPLLSTALLVLAPLLAWAGRLRWKAAREWAGREQEILSRHALEESWSWRAAPESRASGTGRLLSRWRRQASVALARQRMAGAVLTTRGQALTEATAHAAGWILAALALLGWTRGLLSAPDLLAFLAAALLAYRPIREAGRALPSWHRLRSVLERSASMTDSVPTPPPGPAIVVRDLRVSAPDGTILVDGPSFELVPGGVFLVSGANGSGKTSLISGLLGWREASGILSRPASIRALAQEPVLPPLSPRRWSGTDDPGTLPLYRALFPQDLPCSWDEPIAEGGSRLSRGERARLALLCLTATPADAWLFDEPFSALPMAERVPLLAALRSVQGAASFLFSDPLSIDPADAPIAWEPGPGRKGPRIYRL